jgi:hypothetical protein
MQKTPSPYWTLIQSKEQETPHNCDPPGTRVPQKCDSTTPSGRAHVGPDEVGKYYIPLHKPVVPCKD